MADDDETTGAKGDAGLESTETGRLELPPGLRGTAARDGAGPNGNHRSAIGGERPDRMKARERDARPASPLSGAEQLAPVAARQIFRPGPGDGVEVEPRGN